jgi:hypothetical protein
LTAWSNASAIGCDTGSGELLGSHALQAHGVLRFDTQVARHGLVRAERLRIDAGELAKDHERREIGAVLRRMQHRENRHHQRCVDRPRAQGPDNSMAAPKGELGDGLHALQ